MGATRGEADSSIGEWRCIVPFLNLEWPSTGNGVGCAKDALRIALLEHLNGEETGSKHLTIGVSLVRDA
jgi:hypothetical protein